MKNRLFVLSLALLLSVMSSAVFAETPSPKKQKEEPKNAAAITVVKIVPKAADEKPAEPDPATLPLKYSGKALKFGMQGLEVEKVQNKLKDFGYYRGLLDGDFGSATFSAVYTFQSANNLNTDGIVGEATIAALNLPKEKIAKPPAVDASRGFSRGGLEVLAAAKSFLGTPYVWGGAAPGGFDCSGYIYYIFAMRGMQIPRMADGQFTVGIPVQRQNLQAGDLVFFETYEPGPSHVGIYMGDGNFIHASSAAAQVTITSLSKAYYVERYLGAKRLVF